MKKIIVIVFAIFANMAFAKESFLGTLNGERFLRLSEITSNMERICKEETAPAKIKTNCFNRFLFPIMLNKWEFKNLTPLLKKFTETSVLSETAENRTQIEVDNILILDNRTSSDVSKNFAVTPTISEYLVEIENFLQINAENKGTISKSEATQVISAVLNVESAFMEFDKDQDNILSYEELLNVFKSYRDEFASAFPLGAGAERYSQSLFLYQTLNRIELKNENADLIKLILFDKCVTINFCREENLEFKVGRSQIAYIMSRI